MHPFSIHYSPTGSRIDLLFYVAIVASLAAYLGLASSSGLEHLGVGLLVLCGFAIWSFLEYLLHRFVLHGVAPFRHWHRRHHDHPSALIGAPTLLSATLLVALVYVPAVSIAGSRLGCALALGVTAGYLYYSVTHHAIHHWRARSRWLIRRRCWHARHHSRVGRLGRFGVTNELWDQIFGTGSSSSP